MWCPIFNSSPTYTVLDCKIFLVCSFFSFLFSLLEHYLIFPHDLMRLCFIEEDVEKIIIFAKDKHKREVI